MKFVALSGSHRTDSESSKVAHWLIDHLKGKGHEGSVIDLGKADIPLWSTDAWDQDSELSAFMKPFLKQVDEADALILVSPEWAGMVPGALKNFLLYVSGHVAAYKPTLIVGVSSGRGGIYPVNELRVSSYKNTRLSFIPDNLIVQVCETVMNDHDMDGANADDKEIKKRSAHVLNVLVAYAKALKPMREENDLIHPDYPFGV
ncbi:MAG: hypothetical protein CBB87_01780 [Micavibrio sp. TMED27]|nr:NADPH-dependent oxidoreductase [Micavibrio sp.]OUT92494.1 MAG: hypothetical protein CBB87_01780 [Micavibrio sp. TMED27]|tara:strand:- start:6393 stop:7001 length:609 start_codon:yes stop_codon:yes gene_type:complete